jgi:hypothetical protein
MKRTHRQAVIKATLDTIVSDCIDNNGELYDRGKAEALLEWALDAMQEPNRGRLEAERLTVAVRFNE